MNSECRICHIPLETNIFITIENESLLNEMTEKNRNINENLQKFIIFLLSFFQGSFKYRGMCPLESTVGQVSQNVCIFL